jgi:hypothetical protein
LGKRPSDRRSTRTMMRSLCALRSRKLSAIHIEHKGCLAQGKAKNEGGREGGRVSTISAANASQNKTKNRLTCIRFDTSSLTPPFFEPPPMFPAFLAPPVPLMGVLYFSSSSSAADFLRPPPLVEMPRPIVGLLIEVMATMGRRGCDRGKRDGWEARRGPATPGEGGEVSDDVGVRGEEGVVGEVEDGK